MMSPFLCFVCHSTVNADTNEDTREKYREVIGMNLCPDSHLCYICCYFVNKMWLFKSICLKRSLEYPVLFSEKGTINLQRSDTTVAILCPEDICIQHINTRYHFYNHNDNSQSDFGDSSYCELHEDKNFDINDSFLKTGTFENFINDDYLFASKDNVDDNLFNENLILPNLEPVRVTQNDLVNGEWTHNITNDINFNVTNSGPVTVAHNDIVNREWLQSSATNDSYRIEAIPVHPISCRNEITIDGLIVPVPVNDTASIRIENNVPVSIDQSNVPIDQNNVSINIDQNSVPISIDQRNLPINIDQRNVPISIDQRNLPINIDQRNVPISIDQRNVPISMDQRNVPMNIDQSNVPMNIDQSNVPINIDQSSVPISMGDNNVPMMITIEGGDVPNIECNETPNFEEVMMVNNFSFNPETDIYEQIESKIDEETANDINETIGINLDEDMDSNLSEDILANINDDLVSNILSEDMGISLHKKMIYNENIHGDSDSKNTEKGSSSEEETDAVLPVSEDRKKKPNKIDFYYDKIELTFEEQKKELEKARKDEKYIKASFKCHSCAIHFNFKDTYQTHMMRHEESNGEYCCRVCSLRFASAAVLRKHSANHRARYACGRCAARVRESRRRAHAQLCMRLAHSERCDLCGHAFPTMASVRQHIKRYHRTAEKPIKTYPCNVCGKSYSTRAQVRTHILTHINKKFDCDQCPAKFSSPYSLNQHKKWKHDNLAEPTVHNCSTCQVSYSTRKSLMAHYRNSVAHKDSGFQCATCGRVCPTKRSLEGHTAAVHARTRHLACDLCPHKKYSTKKALLRHMACHKEGKPVPLCHGCGARFQSVTVLKRHLQSVCRKLHGNVPKEPKQSTEPEMLQVPFFQ